MDPDKLRELSKKLAHDPTLVGTLTVEEANAIRQSINPLANVVRVDQMFANLSIINMKDIDMRRLHMTGLIGWLFRLAFEYEPEDEVNEWKAELKTQLDKCETEQQRATTRERHEQRVKDKTKHIRSVILKFLNRHLKFNPDKHVREAHSSNVADTERKTKECVLAELKQSADRADLIKQKFSEKPEMFYTYIREASATTYQCLQQCISHTEKILQKTDNMIVLCPNPDMQDLIADHSGIIYKKYVEMTAMSNDLAKITAPILQSETIYGCEISPSADAFYHYDRYLTNHYEQINAINSAVYGVKPDIEFMVVFYNAFKTEEEAIRYKKQKADDFRLEVHTVENAGMTLMGPFKENRDRIDYYNKNTEVIEGMVNMMKQDHKLGKDILDKGTKIKKMSNIKEMGLDAKGLEQYIKVSNTVQDLGAKRGLTREEQEEFVKARDIKEDMEVPKGAIQSNMYVPQINDDGEMILERKKVFTQAEAPLFLQKDSEYATEYQPIKENPEVDGDTGFSIKTSAVKK